MKELHSFLPRAQRLFNELSEEMNEGRADLRVSEMRVLEFIHELGHQMLQEVVEGVLEPVYENQVIVEGKKARYKDQQQLSFRDRFGAIITHGDGS